MHEATEIYVSASCDIWAQGFWVHFTKKADYKLQSKLHQEKFKRMMKWKSVQKLDRDHKYECK